jgi:hypothetical protein
MVQPCPAAQEQRKEIDPYIAAKCLIFLKYISGHYKLLRIQTKRHILQLKAGKKRAIIKKRKRWYAVYRTSAGKQKWEGGQVGGISCILAWQSGFSASDNSELM